MFFVSLVVALGIGVRYCQSFDRLLLKSNGRAVTAARFHLGKVIIMVCGWICNLVPYILVDLSAFQYQYLPGMFYGRFYEHWL